jgi:hypothetical protein
LQELFLKEPPLVVEEIELGQLAKLLVLEKQLVAK